MVTEAAEAEAEAVTAVAVAVRGEWFLRQTSSLNVGRTGPKSEWRQRADLVLLRARVERRDWNHTPPLAASH